MVETQKYLSHKFIKPNSVESRDYQINLADGAKKENSLIKCSELYLENP